MSKIKKFLLSLLILLLLVATGIGLFIGNLFYNIALNPNISKDIVYANQQGSSDNIYNTWFEKESNYTDEYINSFDDLKLHAYVINQNIKTNKWVIIVHGYGGKAKLMSDKAKHFYEMGYNILIPDLRGHGKSEGDYIGMGWDDRLDIISWIENITDSNSDAKIMLHGTSMGAAAVLMASGEELPSNVKSIVSDCAYTSVWDEFSYELKTYLDIPSFPLIDVSDIVTRIRAGYSLKEASAIDQVKKSKIPILYIHGDSDKFVPYSMMNELYKATNSPKEKLLIEGGDHANSDWVNESLYWSTVNSFSQKYINN